MGKTEPDIDWDRTTTITMVVQRVTGAFRLYGPKPKEILIRKRPEPKPRRRIRNVGTARFEAEKNGTEITGKIFAVGAATLGVSLMLLTALRVFGMSALLVEFIQFFHNY